jgi:MFS transporter, DHA1 family, inner membrane transport protein
MKTRGVVLTLFFGAFVANMNGFALGPFLTIVADDIDSTAPLVGQAVTVALVAGAVFGLVLGPMGDHYGLRRLLVGAALLVAVSGVGTALVFNYWSLVLTRIPGGIAAGLILGLGISVINTRLPEEQRRSAIAWVASAGAMAAIFGVPILALIAEHVSWRAGFWLVGLLGLALPLTYFRLVSPDPPVPKEPFRISGVLGTYRGILEDARMTGLQLGNLLWFLTWMGALTYLGAYLMQELGASIGAVGYVFMLGGACFFLGNRSAVWLTNVWSPQSVIILVGLILGMTVVFVFSLSTSMAVAVIAAAMMCAASGIGIPVITILISETATGRHGTVMMLRQFTLGMGSALGAAFGGLLLMLGGFGLLGMGFASIVLLAVFSMLLALRPVHVSKPQPVGSQD